MKMSKKLLGLILVLFLSFITVNSVLAADKPVKLRYASFFPENQMMSEIQKVWQQEVTKRTKGLITFENYWGASMGAPMNHLELIKKGTAQVGCMHEWYTPSRFIFGNFEYVFPFGPTDYEIVAKANRQIRAEFPQFAQDAKKENIIMLMDAPGGEYNFMSTKPLKNIADFKGEKVTLVGRYFGRWLPPGATAVVRPVAERYDLLRTGVVTADLLPFEHFDAFKIYEVAKYYINTRMTTALYGPIYMNLDTFNSFSPEIQKILLDTGKDVEMLAAKEIIPKKYNELMKTYKAVGVTFIEFPQAEIDKWVALLPDIPAEFAAECEAKGYPGNKLIQRWQEITAELGYKWPRKWGKK